MKTKLGTQVHLTISPTLTERIIDVYNVRGWGVKPKGGLWTSSYIDGTCGWVEWCESENFLDIADHWPFSSVTKIKAPHKEGVCQR